ncbi:MAG: hypothetical protein ACKO23_17680 [Gemmataceae bacterium]
MDDRLRYFFWILTGVGSFGLLLSLFGALAGVVGHRQGRAGGTIAGLGVARAFARHRDRKMAPHLEAGLVGAIDGLVFGVFIGLIVGLLAAQRFPAEWEFLRPVWLAAAMLAGAAAGFGMLAHLLNGSGYRGPLAFFLGGMAGALLGFYFHGPNGLMLGCLGGGLMALVVMFPRRED